MQRIKGESKWWEGSREKCVAKKLKKYFIKIVDRKYIRKSNYSFFLTLFLIWCGVYLYLFIFSVALHPIYFNYNEIRLCKHWHLTFTSIFFLLDIILSVSQWEETAFSSTIVYCGRKCFTCHGEALKTALFLAISSIQYFCSKCGFL